MSSLRDSTPKPADAGNFANEERCRFRRRIFSRKEWRIPRRYVMAIMMFIALMIQVWRFQNVVYMLVDAIHSEDASSLYPSVGNWTVQDIEEYSNSIWIAEMCSQIPAALLIYISSSHKFLSASVAISSILHLFTPVALSHHSWTLVIVLFSQGIALAPIRVCVLTLWKDWAPPDERTKLLIFSFSGTYILVCFPSLHILLLQYISTRDSFYLSGVCGLVWSLFWYVATSDKPNNDPFISESEYFYLQNSIPPTGEESCSLIKVPWKHILTSKPIWTLSLMYFKVGCSLNVIMIGIILYSFKYMQDDLTYPYHIFISYLVLYILVLLITAIAGDFLSKRYRGHICNVRRGIVCGSFILHAVLLLGTIFPDFIAKSSFFFLSYIIFLISIPGFITIALDLSGRYVAIVGGLLETFFSLGALCCHLYLDWIVEHMYITSFEWLYLYDGILAILAAGAFFRWGYAEEVPWSVMCLHSGGSTDYQRYPSPEDEDDVKLVSESV